jgi:ABC-type molybdate transport system substrate-binding protein
MKRRSWKFVDPRTPALVSVLGIWLAVSPVQAGTVTIAVTPAVVNEVQIAAQAFEEAYPDDRVRLVVSSQAELKQEVKKWPVQILVSDDVSLLSWMEARELVSRSGVEPAVHRPLAIVVGAEYDIGVHGLRTLLDRMRSNGTRIVILDPQTTDCGRRAQAFLETLKLGADWTKRLRIATTSQDAVTQVRTGEAHLGVLFTPDAVSAEGITVQAVSAPDRHASVHLFAVKRGQQDHPVAQRFLAFVNTLEGQAALSRGGYELVEAPEGLKETKRTHPPSQVSAIGRGGGD